LQAAQKFEEPDEIFSPEEANQLSRIDIHHPLAERQSVSERRQAMKLAFEIESER
jgi:hypothetical protein